MIFPFIREIFIMCVNQGNEHIISMIQVSGILCRFNHHLKTIYMKQLLPLLFIILLLTNCEEKKELHMKGAYQLVSQTLNDGTKDSVIQRKQLKIYTDDHVMYAAMRLPDSLASYGIGTYEIQEDGNVIEHFFHTSANGARKDTFLLKIEKTDKGYKQIIENLPSQGRTLRLTEVYEAVGKNDSSALDGAWKQVRNIYISPKGDSSVIPDITQFKVYQSGNFIWAASYPDSARRVRTFFGYGNFEMAGNNASKEVNHLSTYPPIIDSTFNIQIEIIGSESYQQIIQQRDSSKAEEVYLRLKK